MKPVMLQFKHKGATPTVDEVTRLFNLEIDEIDADFGVVATDPDEGLYTVLVDVEASERIEAVLAGRPSNPAEGLFANPRIEPTDPIEK